MTLFPPDIRQAASLLLGAAVLCAALAAAYTQPVLFMGPLGEGLPRIVSPDYDLSQTLGITARMLALWAIALIVLARPAVASVVRDTWRSVASSRGAVAGAWGCALGLAALYTVSRFAFNIESPFALLQGFTDGVGGLPFQYRALVPWLVRGITEAVPALARADVRVLYAPFEFAAALGVYAAFAYLLRTLGLSRRSAAVVALGVFVPLAFNLTTPWRYYNVYFAYDTPSVAFFTLGLALLLDGRLPAYYALFVLATLNRETTCFLAMAYVALSVGRERPMRIAAHVAAQTALWGLLKTGLAVLYAGNPVHDPQTGPLFAGTLDRSARILVTVPGLAYVLFVTMGGLAAVAFLLRGRIRDARVRRLAWIAVPFLAGMAVVGELMEVRIYSELIPLVAASLALAVRSVVVEAAEAAEAAMPSVALHAA